MKNIIALIVVIGIVVGGVVIFNSNKTGARKPEISQNAPTTSSNSKVTAKEFSIIAKTYAFEPAEIRVKQGDTVRLKIKSVDVDHGFALPDFNVAVDLLPGKEETVEFVANKKGQFTFFCSIYCGHGHTDMKGMLLVE